jgi:hypothetical protein
MTARLTIIFLLLALASSAFGQSTFNPNWPVTTFNPNSGTIPFTPASPAGYSPVIPGEDAAWIFDGNLLDSGPNGYSTLNTNNGGFSYTTGQDSISGHAMSVNGTSQYATFGAYPSYTTGNFSINEWIYPTTLNGNNVIWITGAYQSKGFYLNITSDGGINVSFNTSGAHTATYSDDSIYTIPLNQWSMITMIRSNALVLFYLDGTNFTESNPASGNYYNYGTMVSPIAGGALAIGADTYNGGSPQNFFTGRIDDTISYSFVLSPTQITQMFTNVPATQ